MRSEAPSAHDWVEAITATHRFETAPPGVQKVWAYVGFLGTRLGRYAWTHRWAAVVVHALAWIEAWLTHPLWHHK